MKVVAGTDSPTRYTKIIRHPGEGTKYNPTYEQVDYVSRYTKTAAPGISYVPPVEPEPEPEPEPDPTTIGELTKYLNGSEYNDDPIEVRTYDSCSLGVSISGDADPTYRWTVARGEATLSPSTTNECTVTINAAAPNSVQIQCDIIDITATDSPQSYRYLFVVVE